MTRVFARAIVLFAAFLGAESAQAQNTYSAYINSDGVAATGCTVTLPGGTFTGADFRVQATATVGTTPTVTGVTLAPCAGGTFGPGAPVSSGSYPVGLNNGTGGTDVVEFAAPTSVFPASANATLGFTAQAGANSDVLFTTTGGAGGLPIQIQITVPIPVIGIPAMLLLALAMLIVAKRFGRHRLLVRVVAGGLLIIGGAALAANFVTDGQVGDWTGVAPAATDPAGDSTGADSTVDIRTAFVAIESGRVFFRLDIADMQTQAPQITSANNTTFTIGTAGSFNVTATGVPNPALSINCVPALPPSVTFTDNGNATGTLAGTPASGTANTYSCTITANNGIAPNATQSFTFTIAKANTTTALTASPNPSVFGQSVTLTATVSTTSTLTPAGTVNFMDGATLIGTGTLNGSGVATLSTATLTPGTHALTAVYLGNVDFNGSTSNTVNQVVNQGATATTLTSGTNPSLFGQSVTFTATVTATAPAAGTPTGTVNFLDGATNIGSGTLNGAGVATLAISTLAVGSHSITAVYAGDTNFTTSTSAPLTQVVNQAASTTTVASSVNPSVLGQPVTFTATVTVNAPGAGTPTGTVNFLDGVTNIGSGTLAGGTATLTTSTLAVGAHTITAQYVGNTSISGSTSVPITQMVNQDATTTALTSNTNPSIIGQNVTFTATVTVNAPGAGTPTGTVQFMDGAAPLGGPVTLNASAVATFSTSTLTVATHPITAVYSGDANDLGSTSNTVSQLVTLGQTSTALASSQNPTVFGQSTTFTATVTAVPPAVGTPTGTVQFMDGAAALGAPVALNGSGVATFTSATLAVGSHPITAVYSGNASFATSTSPIVTQVVNLGATTTTVASGTNPSVFGQSVTFTATVSVTAPAAGTPTGTVNFFDGVTMIGSGALAGATATFSTSTLAVGAHTIRATYAGDANFATSTSTPLTQNVNAAATTTTLGSSANPAVFAQNVTFTATVAAVPPGAGTPTGTVNFRDGVTVIGSGALAGGVATFSTSTLSVASHPITAVYMGDPNFTTSTSNTVNQVVNAAPTTTALVSSLNPSGIGQAVTFTATVTANAPSSGTPTGTVNFLDGVTNIGSGTLNGSGVATLTTSALAGGSHSITAVYAGDGNYATSTSNTVTQNVDAAPQVTTVAPLNAATQVATNASLTINFDENVNIAAGGVTLNCAGAITLTGLPAANVNTVTLTHAAPLPEGTLCTATVVATNVTDFDSIDPPDNMAANFVWTFTTDSAPTVTFATPSGTAVGNDASFTINFSEPVDLTATAITLGCPGAFAFTTTPALPATGISSILVDPTGALPNGATCTLTAVAAQISDSDAGDPPNNPAANAVATYTTDAAPVPTIASPANGSTQQSTTASITVNFSENVDLTASAVTLNCAGNIALTGLPASNVNTVTLTHAAVPEGTLCTVTVVAAQVTDTDAVDPPNNPTADVTSTFTTDVAPTVTGTTPIDTATNVDPSANLVVNFSEPVNFALGDFAIVCNAVAQTFSIAGNGTNTATLTPGGAGLLAGASCVFTITGAGITDTDAGDPPNSIAGNTVVNFMTRAIANDDSFAATPHLTLNIAATGVKANDNLGAAVITGFGSNNPAGTCTGTAPAGTGASALGGRVILNLDGSLTYFPPALSTGVADSFCYTITGGDTAVVTLTIAANELVWFVDSTPPANPACVASLNGTQGCPVATLAAATAADTTNDTIFVAEGAYTCGITLLASERLVGDGSGSDLATISGVTPVAGSAFPAFTGNAPTLSSGAGVNCVTTSTGNTVRGLTIGDSGGATGDSSDILGNTFGTLTLGEMTFNGTGRTLDLTTGTLAMTGTGVLNLISTASTAGGLSLNTVGGTLTVAGAGATSITTSAAASTGINIVSSGATINLDDTTVTKSNTGPGVNLNANTGTITFNTLAVSTTAGTAVTADTCTSVVVTNAAGSTINATGGPAVNSTGTGWNAAFTSTTSSGSGTQGVNLNNITGTLALGTGSITTTTGTSFFGQGTLGTTSYAGSITKASAGKIAVLSGAGATTSVTLSGTLTCNTGCTGLDVLNRSAGTYTFSGATKTLNTGASPGVTLTSNAGATINFTGGGLDIDTTSATGFSATGAGPAATTGGTVTVQAGANPNTIDSTAGTALNILNTTIGAADLTFRSISAGTAAGSAGNGIVLDNTGASGNLVVTGTGAAASGGTIQHKTGADLSTTSGIGIYLNSTAGVSLTNMQLNDFDNFAIYGNNVVGFDLISSVISGANGTTGGAPREGSVTFLNLTGAANITSDNISGAFNDNFRVLNTSGTLNRLIFSSVTIGPNNNPNGNDGISIETQSTAVARVTVQNSFFTSAAGDLFQLNSIGTGAGNDLIFTGNALSNNHPAIATGGGGVTIGGADAYTFSITNNTFRDAVGHAVLIVHDTGNTVVSGTFSSNTIGVAGTPNSGSAEGDGIKIQTAGQGTMSVTVNNNQIHQFNNFGIEVLAGGGATAMNGTINTNLTNNTIDTPGNTVGTLGLPKNGIHYNIGTVAAGGGDTYFACAGITGNMISTSGKDSVPASGLGDIDFRLRQRQATTIRLPGYAGANNDNAAVLSFVTGNNSGGGVPVGLASNTVPTGGGFVGGAACPTP